MWVWLALMAAWVLGGLYCPEIIQLQRAMLGWQ
jgi:hypothetical protein